MRENYSFFAKVLLKYFVTLTGFDEFKVNHASNFNKIND